MELNSVDCLDSYTVLFAHGTHVRSHVCQNAVDPERPLIRPAGHLLPRFRGAGTFGLLSPHAGVELVTQRANLGGFTPAARLDSDASVFDAGAACRGASGRSCRSLASRTLRPADEAGSETVRS